jgi:hypothetical protein
MQLKNFKQFNNDFNTLERQETTSSGNSSTENGMNIQERNLYRLMKHQYHEEGGAVKVDRRQTKALKK